MMFVPDSTGWVSPIGIEVGQFIITLDKQIKTMYIDEVISTEDFPDFRTNLYDEYDWTVQKSTLNTVGYFRCILIVLDKTDFDMLRSYNG